MTKTKTLLFCPYTSRPRHPNDIASDPEGLLIVEDIAAPTLAAAKTPAQRQAERKARELAAGRVQWKCWVHPDDVALMREHAAKLARRRERQGVK
jgi:hypothetical protein